MNLRFAICSLLAYSPHHNTNRITKKSISIQRKHSTYEQKILFVFTQHPLHHLIIVEGRAHPRGSRRHEFEFKFLRHICEEQIIFVRMETNMIIMIIVIVLGRVDFECHREIAREWHSKLAPTFVGIAVTRRQPTSIYLIMYRLVDEVKVKVFEEMARAEKRIAPPPIQLNPAIYPKYVTQSDSIRWSALNSRNFVGWRIHSQQDERTEILKTNHNCSNL